MQALRCQAVAEPPAQAAPAAHAASRQYQAIPDIFAQLAEAYPDDLALQDPHHQDARDLTFKCAQTLQPFTSTLVLYAGLSRCAVCGVDMVQNIIMQRVGLAQRTHIALPS